MSWEDKGMLVPRRAIVAIEDVEAWKEDSRLVLTEPLRESIGEVVSGG